jgi:hypothetical protein
VDGGVGYILPVESLLTTDQEEKEGRILYYMVEESWLIFK